MNVILGPASESGLNLANVSGVHVEWTGMRIAQTMLLGTIDGDAMRLEHVHQRDEFAWSHEQRALRHIAQVVGVARVECLNVIASQVIGKSDRLDHKQHRVVGGHHQQDRADVDEQRLGDHAAGDDRLVVYHLVTLVVAQLASDVVNRLPTKGTLVVGARPFADARIAKLVPTIERHGNVFGGVQTNRTRIVGTRQLIRGHVQCDRFSAIG